MVDKHYNCTDIKFITVNVKLNYKYFVRYQS